MGIPAPLTLDAREIAWTTIEAGQFYMVQVGYEVVTIGEVMSRTQFCHFWAEHLTFSDAV